MATFRKRKNSWRAEVYRKGIRKSETFATRAAAIAWATSVEADIIAEKRGEIPNKTFDDLLVKYRDDVAAHKRGERWERLRIELLRRDTKLSGIKLREFNATHAAAWRDRRLKEVSAASVRREWTILSHMANIAVKEWHWLHENPFKAVRRPPPAKSRDRRPTAGEIKALMHTLGYERHGDVDTKTARVGAAFLFAIETGMRAGEIAGLTADRVDLKARTAKLAETKNGHARVVPLTTEAVRIIEQVQGAASTVFQLETSTIDALFRKAKKRALIENLTFHDSRHEAITRLSKKLDVLDLARMVGIRDLRILMVYYNATAAEIAERLK